MAEMWQSKLASKERCRSIVKCFGVWLTFFPFLFPKEQVDLQGLDHWTYETGVPRAIRIIPIGSVHFFPWNTEILMLKKGWNDKVAVLQSEVDSYGWSSIQIRQHIFQTQRNGGDNTRMLENHGFSFIVVAKASMNEWRRFPSICSMQEKFIFATGGCMKSVERYDVTRDVWEEMPEMNVARRQHGSCSIGTSVYVLCGIEINSVEKLETLDLHTRGLQAGWQLIHMPRTSLLTPRHAPVVAALNSSGILIMGGNSVKGLLADALTLDTRTNSVKIVMQKAQFNFLTLVPSAHAIGPGVVVAWVIAYQVQKLIEYRGGSIRCLYTFTE